MVYYAKLEGSLIINHGEISYDGDLLSEFLTRMNAILITKEQEKQIIENGQSEIIAGVICKITNTISLAEAKNKAQYDIDIAAENARRALLTNGIGQSSVYQLKGDEAKRFLIAFEADSETALTENWPFLSAEVGITGDTLYDVAVIIKQAVDNWIQLTANIENIRLGVKKTINNANTIEEIPCVIDIVWP